MPETDALAVKRPGVPLATNGGEGATPEASVVAVACGPPPRKLAPAPDGPVAIANVTVTPETAAPWTSSTRACSALVYCRFTVADWSVVPVAPTDEATPLAVLCRSNETLPYVDVA